MSLLNRVTLLPVFVTLLVVRNVIFLRAYLIVNGLGGLARMVLYSGHGRPIGRPETGDRE